MCDILQAMVQVAMSTKTNKIGVVACALLHANLNFCNYAPREGVPPQLSWTAKEGTRGLWSEGSRGGYGEWG